MVFADSISKKGIGHSMLNINQIRKDFPILQTKIHGKPLVYLDNAATTQKPQVVLDKIVEFYSSKNSNIHRGVHHLSELASNAYEDARKTVQGFINAKSDSEIIFTSGTTEAINLVANSFGSKFIREKDEIIISEMEHHSNIVPWQILCELTNAVLKVVPFDDDGILRMEELKGLITEKTKLIAIVYVSNALGVINPLKDIIDLAHCQDIPVLIDGAQAVQHIPVDVQDLDCDFFAFSGHKMYAETGIGVLYGKERWLENMPPFQSGGGMLSNLKRERVIMWLLQAWEQRLNIYRI
jgi:cysteine desulfurase/selenocysteine lyase